MDLATETRWREGLEQAGREAVQRYLTARPGAAEDPIDEFVFEAPYPTRAFCRDWCAEKDSIIYEVSGRSISIGVLVAIIAIAGSFAFGDLWRNVNHATRQDATNGYGPTHSASAGKGGGGAPGASSVVNGGASDLSTALDEATNLDTPIGGPAINTAGASAPVGGPTVLTPRVDQTVIGSTAATSPTPAPPIATPFPGMAPTGPTAGSLTVWTPNATSPLGTPWPGPVSPSRSGATVSAPVVTPTQTPSPTPGQSGGGGFMRSKPQTSK